jgi:rhombotail lipoprotein
MRRVAPLTALLLLTSCFSPRGFDRGALTRAARVEHQEATDAEIARVLALCPQLGFPFRVAVWFRTPGRSRARFQWRDEDRQVVLGALRPLVASGIVADVAAISDTTIMGEDLRAARLAAARHGADAVLIVSGAAEVDRYGNWASLLYATIVGLWVVPGSHADGIFLASGSLWDVRNEFLYATAEAEGTFGRTRPALLLEDGEAIAGAKRVALSALATELGARLRSLREAPAAATRRD